MYNQFLMCAFNLYFRHRSAQPVRLYLLTDNPDQYTKQDCLRALAPWRDWAAVRDYLVVTQPADANLIKRLPDLRDSRILGFALDPAIQNALRSTCRQLGVPFVEPNPTPPWTSLEDDFFREVLHFDSEYCGIREWDSVEVRYSALVLRTLSAVQCRANFPMWPFWHPSERVQLREGLKLKVLDIGCGPVSVLRWGAIQNYLSITGVDPLLELYALVLARHGLDRLPKIRCETEISAYAETLADQVPDNHFDMIYTRNALDHTQDPVRVVENFGRKLAPGGIAAIEVAAREGTRQNWDQLHKTDIYFDDRTLMYAHQDGQARPLIPPASGLRLREVVLNTPDWLACTLDKVR